MAKKINKHGEATSGETGEKNGGEDRRHWTPFADAIDAFLYEQSARDRSHWSRHTLADALGVSPSTINAWFNRQTLPDAYAIHQLLKLTGWDTEKMLRLTGRTELPPYTLSETEYIRQAIANDERVQADQRAKWLQYFDEYVRAYKRLPRQKRQSRATKAPSVVTTPATESAPTHETAAHGTVEPAEMRKPLSLQR